jgi:hypothetical protein
MSSVRRARGAMLRLARHRRLSLLIGLAMALPGAWIQIAGRFDEWWIEGLSLVGIGIGIALVWTALVGLQPDWIDKDET